LAVCGWLLVAAAAHAATIRGKLVHKNNQPATGYEVTISNGQAGRSTPARAGADGMYYIYNIAPGAYDLEVWVPGAKAPAVYRINVVEPNTDVPQLSVP
jgi:hypothetical protein